MGKKEIGQKGEDIAATFLRKKGFIILERNYHCKYGEIDLVVKKKGFLVFVEVKARSSMDFGTPEEAVTPAKLEKIIATGYFYQSQHQDAPQAMRVDVIAIEFDEKGKLMRLEHLQNVE
jgi:putative endonuclease